MTDIQTGWDRAAGGADWIFLPGNTETSDTLSFGNDLATAALISIFTDAQADEGDTVPDGSTDRRGWWGDSAIGSKVWLEMRGKALPDLPGRVEQAVSDCLQWMIEDGIAGTIDVAAAYGDAGQLGLAVTIHRADGAKLALQFADLWQYWGLS